MEVTLTVLERLVLGSILPKEGNFINLKLVRKFREAVSFNELELKKLKFQQKGDRVEWDQTAAVEVVKKLKIGDSMCKIVADALKELDKTEKLTEEHFSLYEKFVEEFEAKPPLEVVPPKPEGETK